jgi:predicted alpha/beta superfamily hydrolase/TolA-binding protein
VKRNNIGLFIVFLLITFFYSEQNLCFAQQDNDDIVIGKYRVFHSDILNEDRLLFIHLPRGYHDTQLSYPVLYLLYVDIYNYYLDAAMITEKLGGTGEMPRMIIIGVVNTNRYRDLLPVRTRDRREGGGADNFLKLLEQELIPFIEKNYRTKNFRILAGPQAAAIFSLYTVITKPKLFNAVIAENPFMSPENAAFLFPKAEAFFKKTKTLKGFYYIKCEKNERSQDLEYAKNLDKLIQARPPQGFRFQVEFREPSGYFISPLPFSKALRSLFASFKLPDNFQTNSLDDLLGFYQNRSEEYGFKVDPPDLTLTFEGNKLRRRGNAQEAIKTFEYMLKLYPKSLNALFQLGESYRGMGNFEKARQYYQAFLDIQDRDAALIQRRVKQIEKMIKSSAVYRIEQVIRKNGIQAGLKKYHSIKSDPKNELYFDENEFNGLGYRLMGAKNMKAALEIFKLNVKLYPKSANVYDSLAEAFMKIGDNKNAVKNYKKSLELNPKNNNAREMLKKLESK